MPVAIEWAELRHLLQVPHILNQRIEKSLELYPCDLLFVHKDAERDNPARKLQEVRDALVAVDSGIQIPEVVCLIPVRMQESWLLFDEAAIRRASGNPNGRVLISLPKLKTVENLPDPKDVLYELLRIASERSGRRLKQFNVRHGAGQVSQFIEDFSPLRILPAFQRLEADVKIAIANQCWT